MKRLCTTFGTYPRKGYVQHLGHIQEKGYVQHLGHIQECTTFWTYPRCTTFGTYPRHTLFFYWGLFSMWGLLSQVFFSMCFLSLCGPCFMLAPPPPPPQHTHKNLVWHKIRCKKCKMVSVFWEQTSFAFTSYLTAEVLWLQT